MTAAADRAGRPGRGRSRRPAQRAPRRRPRAGDAVARGLAGGAGRDGRLPAGLRPPPRAPRLHPADDRARAPAGGRRARRSWRRWSASCATRTAASRWASGTRRWRCARRRPAADTSEILAAIGTMADRLARRASAARADAPQRDADRAHRGGGELRREVQVGRRRGDGQRGRRAARGRASATTARPGRACWPRRAAAPIERARAALLRRRAAPARIGRRWRWRRRKRAPGTIAASRRCSRSNIRSRRRCRRRCSGRVRLRRAEAFAWRAFDEARRGNLDAGRARRSGRPSTSWRSPIAGVLAPEDLDLYEEVAIRVAASRWATEPEQKPAGKRAVDVAFAPRGEGETCVRVVQTAAETARRGPLGERCTYGLVWKSALRWAPSGSGGHHRRAAAGRLDRGLGAAARRRRRAGRSRR